MDSAFSLIVARTEDGRSINLYNEAQCAAAVAQGDVTDQSNVVVYVDGKGTSMRAIDHPAFASLVPPPPPAEAPPPVEVPPVAESTAPEPAPDTHVEPAPAPSAPPAPAAPAVRAVPLAVPPPPPPMPQNPKAEQARNVIIALCVLTLLGYCVSHRSPSSGLLDNTSSTTSDNMTTTESDPEANLPVVTRYTLRDVNAQTGATSGTSDDKIERGTEVSGVIVPGSNDRTQSWLKLRSGRYEGRYIWAANLGDSAPPALDTSFAGTKMAFVEGRIRTAPASDAREIGDPAFPVGRTFMIAGKVNNDWAELLLKHGGVGYVEASVFEAPAAAGAGGLHNIVVANECATSSFTFALYYQDASGWHTNNGALWTFPAGEMHYPTVNDVHLVTTSPTIYYAVTAVNDRQQTFTGSTSVQYGSTTLSMRQAVITYADNGDYKISLSC